MTRLREALGPDVALMIDCGGVFSPPAAHRLMRELQPLDLFFVEEPIEQSLVAPYVRLKGDFPGVRVAAGERWITRWDCREWFEKQAVDVCQVDICHAGGISELMKIAHFAEVYGIGIAPHNPYGPVALAAAAHAAAAMQNFEILEHCRAEAMVRRRSGAAGADFGRPRGRRRIGAAPGAGCRTGYGDGEVAAVSDVARSPLRGAGWEHPSVLRDGATPPRRARRVLVMDGAGIDVGTHEELLARHELYADFHGLWR